MFKCNKSRFNEIYSDVFDSDSQIKLCRRDSTRPLIVLANILEPGVNHGDVETGIMDIESIQTLYAKLNTK